MKRIIVTGSKQFRDKQLLIDKLDVFTFRDTECTILTRGSNEGADALAEKWALANWYSVERFHEETDGELLDAADSLVVFLVAGDRSFKRLIERGRAMKHRVRVYKEQS